MFLDTSNHPRPQRPVWTALADGSGSDCRRAKRHSDPRGSRYDERDAVVDGLRITKECAPEEQRSRPNHKWEKRHGDVGVPPSIADPGMSTDAHSDEGREYDNGKA